MASLTQLEYLIAVDRFRHFGRAAKACHVSQPTLSMQLQKMEEEYGIKFFDRDKQPILPTREGIAIIEQAKSVLREVGKLDYLCKNRSQEPVGELKLGLIPTLAPYLLPRFLGSFAHRYPKVQLLIEELTTERIIEALQNDVIDAGLLATPLHVDSLIEKPLFYEPFYVFASEQHPLSREREVDEEELDAKDIWLLSEGHCLRTQIVRVCSLGKKPGIFPNVRFESGSLETIIRLVRQGHGYTLLPYLATEGMAIADKKAMLRPFSKPVPSREVSLVTRRTQYKQPILEVLATEIQKQVPSILPRDKGKEIEVIKIS